MKHDGETVGRPACLGGHLGASGFLLDRMRRHVRPRNRQTRKSFCQPWTRRGHAGPSRDWFWLYRQRGQQRHRWGLSQPLPMASLRPRSPEQPAAQKACSICAKGYELRCVTAIRRNNDGGSVTTVIGYRRYWVGANDRMTIRAGPAIRWQNAPTAAAIAPESRAAVRQSRCSIRRSRRGCGRNQCKALPGRRAHRRQRKGISVVRSLPLLNAKRLTCLSFARNRHDSYKLSGRFSGWSERTAYARPIGAGRANTLYGKRGRACRPALSIITPLLLPHRTRRLRRLHRRRLHRHARVAPARPRRAAPRS